MKKNKRQKKRKKRNASTKKTNTPRKHKGYFPVEMENYTVYFDHRDWPFEGKFTYANRSLIRRAMFVNFLLLFFVLFFVGCFALGVDDKKGVYFMLPVAFVFSLILLVAVPVPHKLFKNFQWSKQAHAVIHKGHLKLTLDGQPKNIPLHTVKTYQFNRNEQGGSSIFGIYMTLLDKTKIKIVQSCDMADNDLKDMSNVAHVIAAALPSYLKEVEPNPMLMSQKSTWLAFGISAVCLVVTCYIYMFAIKSLFFLVCFVGLSLFYPIFMLSVVRTVAKFETSKRYVNTKS